MKKPFSPPSVPRWFRRIFPLLIVPAALVLVYNGCAAVWVKRDNYRAARDPLTGVVVGCEAADLEPNTASRPTRACLLLHGVVGSRKDFADLGERLAAEGFHVRLARIAGHGTTPVDFSQQTSATLLASARDELAALKKDYDEVNVVGFSMGGTLATLLAAEEGVDRLVLVSPYYRVTHRWYYFMPAEKWNDALAPAIPYVPKVSTFVQVNRRAAKKELFSYHAIPTRGTSALIALGREAARRETLGKIECPTLLVMSEGDKAASPAAAREAFGMIGAEQKAARWFTKSNHHLLWDYEGEEAKTAIVKFLIAAPGDIHARLEDE